MKVYVIEYGGSCEFVCADEESARCKLEELGFYPTAIDKAFTEDGVWTADVNTNDVPAPFFSGALLKAYPVEVFDGRRDA